MKKSSLLFVLLFSATFFSFSQDKYFVIDSKEIIKTGAELHDKDKYKEAIVEYQKIPENDTNYVLALYEIALSARADSQFTLAKQMTREAIDQGPSVYDHDLWLMLGSIYDDEKKHDSALAVFNKTVQLFPRSYRAINAKGINFYLQKKSDSAFVYLKEALMMNPYNVTSHYILGMLAYEDGYPIQAMLSFAMSLVLSPDGSRSGLTLNKLYNISNLSDETLENFSKRKESNVFKESYSDLETYFKSKISLERSYKIETKLDEPLFRQLNLIFDKVPISSNTNEFWGNFYVPIYKDIFKKKMFEAFTFRMIEGVNSASAQKLVKSNKSDIEKMGIMISSVLDDYGFNRKIETNPDRSKPGYYFENNALVAKGLAMNGNIKNMQGNWEFYNSIGDVVRSSEFKNSKLAGRYNTYYYTGILKEEMDFENEKINGIGNEYYDTGLPKSKANFTNGNKNGTYYQYYANGSLASQDEYTNGKRNGKSLSYYISSGLRYEMNYVNDQIEGPVKEYYRSGRLYSITDAKRGKAEGDFISYYFNGQVETTGTLKDGNRNGEFVTYDINGKLESKLNYKEGKLDGPAFYYHPNGKESRIASYSKGDQEGEFIDKDEEGRTEAITEYKKGHIKKIKFFNVLTGAVVSESNIDDKQKNLLKLCNKNGNIVTEVVTDRDGMYNGDFKRLFVNGKTAMTSNYEKGKEEGKRTRYFKNGKVREEFNNVDDEIDGEYKSYFNDGKVEVEGKYIKGQKQGYWYTYNTLGNLIEKEYYIDGDYHGPQHYFWGNGKKSKTIYFDKGIETRIVQFDTLGKVIQDYKMKLGQDNAITEVNPLNKKARTLNFNKNYLQGQLINYLPNGQKLGVFNIKNGSYDSTYIGYHVNGKVRTEGFYHADKRQGTWKYYNTEGQLTQISHFVNGDSEGIDSVFDDNGKLEMIIPYKDDDRHGYVCKYAPTGELIYKYHYIDGLIVGYTYEQPDGTLIQEIPVENSGNEVVIKTFYKSGKLASECNYQNGEYQGKRKLYFPDGKLSFEATYLDGMKNGLETEYFPNGKVSYERTEKNDITDGVYKKYNEKGILLVEEHYIQGYEHGVSKYFDASGKLLHSVVNYWGNEISMD